QHYFSQPNSLIDALADLIDAHGQFFDAAEKLIDALDVIFNPLAFFLAGKNKTPAALHDKGRNDN
ncbi:hypothetical protein, partial [Sutcliffiella cohnii]|uniref:hypothetical protein n=1 Tax=Sutcliffiella cohnii TaxID=33932 RepID=UPI000AFA2389